MALTTSKAPTAYGRGYCCQAPSLRGLCGLGMRRQNPYVLPVQRLTGAALYSGNYHRSFRRQCQPSCFLAACCVAAVCSCSAFVRRETNIRRHPAAPAGLADAVLPEIT